jgi:hypothetical protein
MKHDYWVTVCSACRTAACWHGEFLCGRARTADTVDERASVLMNEDREHRGHFTRARLLDVCGSVREAP